MLNNSYSSEITILCNKTLKNYKITSFFLRNHRNKYYIIIMDPKPSVTRRLSEGFELSIYLFLGFLAILRVGLQATTR